MYEEIMNFNNIRIMNLIMLLRTIMPCLRNEQVYDFEKQKKEKTLIKKNA